MRPATEKEFMVMRSCAEEKLAPLKDLIDRREFERLVCDRIRCIARDLGLQVEGTLWDVLELRDLDLFERNRSGFFPDGLFVGCKFGAARDWIAKLAEDGKIMAVFVLQVDPSVEDFAQHCSDVAVFAVKDRAEADQVLSELRIASHVSVTKSH